MHMSDMFDDLPRLEENHLAPYAESDPSFWETVSPLYASGVLQLIVNAIMFSGLSTDVPDALEHARSVINDALEHDSRHVALGDLNGSNNGISQAERELLQIVDAWSFSSSKPLHRVLGTYGHIIVPEILSGRPPAQDMEQAHAPTPTKQPDLFGTQPRSNKPEQLGFAGSGFAARKTHEVFDQRTRRYHQTFIDELQALLRSVWPHLTYLEDNGAGSLFSYEHDRLLLFQLTELLLPVVGPKYLTQFLFGNDREQELLLLTLVNWSMAILEYHAQGPRILFTEVAALSRSIGIEGGYIDAIEVVALDGVKPTREQQRQIEQLRIEYQHRSGIKSIGHLLVKLLQRTGKTPTLRLYDWKFGVGDAVSGEILPPSTRHKAPLKHVSQVKRYLALLPVDYAHVTGRGGNRKWHSRSVQRDFSFAEDGRLVYFLNVPTPPVIHRVQIGADRRAQLLQEMAAKLDLAREKGKARRARAKLCRLGLSRLKQ
jgi:hypothetical protein